MRMGIKTARSRALRPLVVAVCSVGLTVGVGVTAGPVAAAAAPPAGRIDGVATRFLEARNAQLVTGSSTLEAIGAAAADKSPGLTVREAKNLTGLQTAHIARDN